MNHLSLLTEEQLLTVYDLGERLNNAANITVPWMNVPDTDEWNEFVELTNLQFWRDRVIKPIDAINVFKDIKTEMANRWLAAARASVKTENIRIA